ncbi:serine/threonine-protein kinase [Corallococcus exiguus]|uniref:serine/threonine-protein kinase n=1 Tax=Corallococcus exiguus TaxID=83462 RepID=UPI0014722021|nr:serine/threonine-protein kinase [Corallococcus exiguus]NNB91466.1 serine/threonine protein kinase [Corallococcus exiguus]
MALQAGDVFGRYELVSWLGRGGMAETWRAQLVGDAGVTKPVLIKKVLPEYANDEAFISMFISEARISATLSHGNVAQVFDFGRVDGEYFLAMEFVDGQPLHRVLKRALKSDLGALPVPVAVFIAMEMCRGLHYAHTRMDSSSRPLGIVHRDISPDNVLLGYEGQVKIVDFGIAKAQLIRGFKTAPGVVKGKYLFFSPEQARGEDVDARTDVWATGVVLYELLCGKLPVEGPPHVVMMRVGRGEIPAPSVLRPDLPQELNDIVMKALTPDREQRFESSHAFGDALAGFLYSNFPRFSAMTIAHLLRVLFRGDLAQEGREMSVPGSFLEELKSWRVRTVPEEPVTPPPSTERQTRRIRAATPPPVTETTQPRSIVAAAGASRPLLYGLSAGGLLAVGASVWLLMDAHAPMPHDGAPPPTPIRAPVTVAESPPPPTPANPQPTQGVVTRTSTQFVDNPYDKPQPPPAPETKEAPVVSAKEAADVKKMQAGVARAIRLKQHPDAVYLSNHCVELYPNNADCEALVQQVNDKRFNEPPSPKASASTSARSIPEDLREAMDSEKSIAMHISEIQARVLTLAKSQEMEGALEIAEECAARAPKVPECHLMLGVVNAKLNNREKSEQHFEKFLTLTPEGYPKRELVIKALSANINRPAASQDNP